MNTRLRRPRVPLWVALFSLIFAPTLALRGQATPDAAAEAEAIRRELAPLQSEYAARLAALERRLTALESQPAAAALEPAAALSEATTAAPQPEAETADSPPPAPRPLLSGAGGRNYLNLSLDGLVAVGGSTADDVAAIEVGGHDPAQQGFTVQNVELVLEGAVDPYFRAQANVIFQLTPEGETVVELEEAFATTSSLPSGLQVKAGQFLTEFGRQNPLHPHAWDFVDLPLANGRFFGGDGLRAVGARLSWLMPTSFYSEAYVAVQNSGGETMSSFRSLPGETLFGRELVEREVSGLSDLVVAPRYAASFDLSDTQTLLVGASGAIGPNGTGDDGRTRIYGLDGFWKWKSPTAFQGFPFVKVQGEVMRRELDADAAPDAGLAAEGFDDWGGYLQVNWGFRPKQVVGLRYDRVGGDTGNPADEALAGRWRLSPVFTWFPTEYSKLRLQYNFDRGEAFAEDEHSLWLQLEFLLGAHAAHKF